MNEIYEQQTTSKEERKRMILAVILSTVIVSVGFIVQSVLFPPATQQQTTQGSDQAGANEQAIQQEPSSASRAELSISRKSAAIYHTYIFWQQPYGRYYTYSGYRRALYYRDRCRSSDIYQCGWRACLFNPQKA